MGTRYRANPLTDWDDKAFTITLAHGPVTGDVMHRPLPRPDKSYARECRAIHRLVRDADATIGDVVRGTSDGGDYEPEHVSVIVGTVNFARVNDVLQVAHDVAEVLDEECLYVNVGGDAYLVGPGA